MKILKPIITLICLIALLVLAIREKHTTEKIINNLLYQEENIKDLGRGKGYALEQSRLRKFDKT